MQRNQAANVYQCGGNGEVCVEPWQRRGGEGAGCLTRTCREAYTEHVQVLLGFLPQC